MLILGINAFHADASAVLLQDGQLVAAVEEERLRRVKHWAGFPREAILKCLEMAGCSPRDVDYFAISRNPRAHLVRKLLFALHNPPNPTWVKERVKNANQVSHLPRALAQALDLDRDRVASRTHWVEHHPAHLASAFFVSPFQEAAVCALDGFGDYVSTSLAVGRDCKLEILDRVFFPHSLGILYLAITQYLGFRKYGDEYKVMGLAAYGKPEFLSQLKELITLEPEGRFQLNLSFFQHWSQGDAMTWDNGEPSIAPVYTPKLAELLGPPRAPEEPLEPRHEAIAASLQIVFEEVVFHILNGLHKRTGLRRLCLAGGCVMNSVANGNLRNSTPFEEIYIQPAAADNGTALGAAYYVWHQLLQKPREFVMRHGYWGPRFSAEELAREVEQRALEARGCRTHHFPDEEVLCRWVAERIAEGRVVGWFQGAMEWGARALGNRSILADPRRKDMRDIINEKIKFRESFRPFAPSVLEEAVGEYFVGAVPDPFMVHVYPVRLDKREVIPAVTHVDGSGRVHTVNEQANPLYYKLIKAFRDVTGVPVLLNTSFNENEPIVHTPAEAMECFLRTRMDLLILGQTVIVKPAGGSLEGCRGEQKEAPLLVPR